MISFLLVFVQLVPNEPFPCSRATQPTFLDQWFTGADLSKYARPMEFGLLNAVEKILLALRVSC